MKPASQLPARVIAAAERANGERDAAAPVKERARVVARTAPRDSMPGANKTEREYGERLAYQQRAGEIQSWGFQRITLKLADDCRLTPDFDYVNAAGELVLVDVKGAKKSPTVAQPGRIVPWIEEDARIKLKVAARMFPFRILIAFKMKREWSIEEVRA